MLVRVVAAGLICALAARAAPAQRMPATEVDAGASIVIAARDFWGAMIGVARRPGDERRFAARVALGDEAGSLAIRATARLDFLLRPTARSGVSPYAGLGVAFAGARRRHGAAYLAAALGLEAAPARTLGWQIEAGLEGGVRLSAGLCWRRFS